MITQRVVRRYQFRTPASGSANESIAVGGQWGSSEQQNEGRLLVSEMASGLQQQEVELCTPSLFWTQPAKSPISTEKCGSWTYFSSSSEPPVLYLRFVDTLWKSCNTTRTMYNHLNPSTAAFNKEFFG